MQVHPIIQELLADIDQFTASQGITASEFGLKSIGDPNLYGDLKSGRNPRFQTLDRIRSFMGEVPA